MAGSLWKHSAKLFSRKLVGPACPPQQYVVHLSSFLLSAPSVVVVFKCLQSVPLMRPKETTCFDRRLLLWPGSPDEACAALPPHPAAHVCLLPWLFVSSAPPSPGLMPASSPLPVQLLPRGTLPVPHTLTPPVAPTHLPIL